MPETPHSLFDDFEPVSSKQWKQRIQYELKGADYNDTLVWESPEGIKVKPFYHWDEDRLATGVVSPRRFGICQEIFVFDLEKSALRAADCLKRGAESLCFSLQQEEIDAAALLEKIPIGSTTLYFNMPFFSEKLLKTLDAIAKKNSTFFYCHIDPIGYLAREGNWMRHKGGDHFALLQKMSADFSHLALLSVDASLYQNAGANITQQLAYTLAHLNEYFNRIAPIQRPVLLKVAIGTNYFFEIAKLRALRLLFELLAKEYDFSSGCHIHAVPTRRNKTLYDYNLNMLRSTTECMSAIAGGADAVQNLPYDALYHKSNEFGERIARNQLLILKEESYFDKTANPADGSYYIESLTAQLAEKALALFKEIEAAGGFIALLKNGAIQRKIRESADKEQSAFDSGKEVLVGTNRHPNPLDRMKDELELFPFVKTKARKTLITPITEKRLAETSEKERLAKENATQTP